MTQYDFGTIDPTATSGTQLALDLDDWRNALESMHSGTSRPSYAQAGTEWLNTSATPWGRYLFDGIQDQLLGYHDPTTGIYQPVIGGGYGTLGSAATTNLLSVTYGTISITGSTPITSFGSPTTGQGSAKFLRFAGSVVLTASSNLLLPGGQNIVTQLGATCTAIYLGSGVWVVIGYTHAFTARTPINDAAYTAAATDRKICYTNITSSRIVTIPPAASFPTDQFLYVGDESGLITPSITISAARSGSDTINKSTTNQVIQQAFGFLILQSDGVSNWTLVAGTATAASLTQQDQTLSGGANVNSFNLGSLASGSHQLDCGKCPLQYLTLTGSITLTAPANDGSCIVNIIMGSGAASLVASGFNTGSNAGDLLNYTVGNIYSMSVWRINGVSSYFLKALQ